MKRIMTLALVAMAAGCGPVSVTFGDSVTAAEVEQFFRKHRVDRIPAAALKKRSVGVQYLATVHGYPNNLSVCNEIIAPYNRDSSLSTIPGTYFCEELRKN
jgi:hypothetical protein